jgi:hypothetical protein
MLAAIQFKIARLQNTPPITMLSIEHGSKVFEDRILRNFCLSCSTRCIFRIVSGTFTTVVLGSDSASYGSVSVLFLCCESRRQNGGIISRLWSLAACMNRPSVISMIKWRRSRPTRYAVDTEEARITYDFLIREPQQPRRNLYLNKYPGIHEC